MSEKPERIDVQIFGATYTLRGGANRDIVRRLAADVDGRMRELADATPGADPMKVAVLSALRMADELRTARTSAVDSEDTIVERIEACAGRLASAVEDASGHGPEPRLDARLPLG